MEKSLYATTPAMSPKRVLSIQDGKKVPKIFRDGQCTPSQGSRSVPISVTAGSRETATGKTTEPSELQSVGNADSGVGASAPPEGKR